VLHRERLGGTPGCGTSWCSWPQEVFLHPLSAALVLCCIASSLVKGLCAAGRMEAGASDRCAWLTGERGEIAACMAVPSWREPSKKNATKMKSHERERGGPERYSCIFSCSAWNVAFKNCRNILPCLLGYLFRAVGKCLQVLGANRMSFLVQCWTEAVLRGLPIFFLCLAAAFPG